MRTTTRTLLVCTALGSSLGCGRSVFYFPAVGDFDGDGWPDLAVTSWEDATVRVLLNACAL